jgi:fatty-acid peroxygenase
VRKSTPRLPTSAFPRLRGIDSTVALLREGYAFGKNRFQRCGNDAFQMRLMLRRAAFAYGAEAAQEFYAPDRLTRRQALPVPSFTLLLDLGSVSMLDGAAHRQRKQMFLSLMTQPALAELADLFERAWRARLPAWEGAGRVVLLDQMREVLCEAV